MRHLMSPLDFSVEELDQLMDLANDIEKSPEKYAHACDGKRLATLFYEPSTRTRLSFEAAMMKLGGTVLGFSSANSSSASNNFRTVRAHQPETSYVSIAIDKRIWACRIDRFSKAGVFVTAYCSSISSLKFSIRRSTSVSEINDKTRLQKVKFLIIKKVWIQHDG